MSTKQEKDLDMALENEDAELQEAAIDTLKPEGGSGGTESKAQVMAAFTQLLAQLGKEDLSDLFNRTLEQIGKESESLPPAANADSNKATIATKAVVKEDMDDLFGEELDEEFRNKASTLFEAAVNTRIALETVRLEEEFEQMTQALEEEYAQKLEEETAQIFEHVSEKLDQYTDYVIKEWMEENKLAIENSLRMDVAENFIQGLQRLFTEHYIEVPESKIDIVAELKAENEALSAKLNEAMDEKIKLETLVTEATKAALIDEAVEGMVEVQAEKFRSLVENIDFEDEATFASKIETIKESIFNKPVKKSTGLLSEETSEESEEVSVPKHMQHYMSAISKISK